MLLASVVRGPVGTANVLQNQNKKADVAEHPKVFDHVGLLVNKPPGTAGLPFI
jgi:hypothetical protein